MTRRRLEGRSRHAPLPPGHRRHGELRRLGRRGAPGLRPLRRHGHHHGHRPARPAGDLQGHPRAPARHLADPVEHSGEPALVAAGTTPADPARRRRRQRPRTRARARRRRRLHLARAGRDDLPLRLAGQGRPPGRRAAARLRAPRAAARLRPLHRPRRRLAGVDGPRDRSRPAGAARASTPICSPRRQSAAQREPRVLYVGRVERTSRWKGLHVLVESLVRLRELVPDVRLDVVGDGDDVTHLRERAEATRCRRPDRLARPGRARRAPALLPARRCHRAAVADRVGVVRHDAGRGDGQRLPGRRVGRRRDPVRDPRQRRRPARPAG